MASATEQTRILSLLVLVVASLLSPLVTVAGGSPATSLDPNCWTPVGPNGENLICTSKGLPQCSKQYLDDIWGAGGSAPRIVPAADRDVDVVVQTSYQHGTGDDLILISSKRICYVTKAQEAAERRQQEGEDRRWRRDEQHRIAECEREPRQYDVLHTEPDGMGCWKTVDQCGETRGTVCGEQ